MHLLFFQRSFSLKLNFRDSKGQLIKTVEASDGDDILSIAHEHDIDLEGPVFIISGPFILP
jgi:ACT domain-containing protein